MWKGLASRASYWGHAALGHAPSLAPFRSPTVVQVAAIAGRARDRSNRRRAADSLIRFQLAPHSHPGDGASG
jgi:hypothetical protein